MILSDSSVAHAVCLQADSLSESSARFGKSDNPKPGRQTSKPDEVACADQLATEAPTWISNMVIDPQGIWENCALACQQDVEQET